ncbi:hypothetical protein JSE7799_03796 [Jannaschia seosinensis]|uniref:Uncharacterized protein n=1 Tax=Jannaschia seosinensis TaxID=313367 RepID=A0A0M7BGN4_9RHOB|nr:hypothetical protein [Jannaschia seosinensis]CUH41053.1 hypothetical protein JSE7799_03796 [Jannaschia seosinensis]
MKHFDRMTKKELCTRILQGLDALHDQAQRAEADMTATDLNTVLQALSALRHSGPLSEIAVDEIGRIEDLLARAIAQETLGFQNVFDGTVDPDLGAVGRVHAVPVLSEKGAALDRLQQGFRQILAMRELLAARIDAGLMMNGIKAA